MMGPLTLPVYYILEIYKWLVLARVLVTWLPMFGLYISTNNPLIRILFQITDPILIPLRRFSQVGSLDLSPLIAFFLIGLVQNFLLGRPLAQTLAFAIALLVAFSVHECAHAWAALQMGDSTAYDQGRLTLDPRKHLDVLGAIMVLAVGFGWAKPVPVNFSRLRQPKRDMLWVAAAGPMANLVMAVLWILVANVSGGLPGDSVGAWFYAMAEKGILINVILMVLNLFPLPPLDGGRIAVSLLPNPYAWRFARIEPYGMLILVVLLVTGVLGALLWPLVVLTTRLLLMIFAA